MPLSSLQTRFRFSINRLELSCWLPVHAGLSWREELTQVVFFFHPPSLTSGRHLVFLLLLLFSVYCFCCCSRMGVWTISCPNSKAFGILASGTHTLCLCYPSPGLVRTVQGTGLVPTVFGAGSPPCTRGGEF